MSKKIVFCGGGNMAEGNKIVENISQLSAVTQEVTVNAEQVHNMSEQNLEYAKQVKEAVGNIRITSEKMEIEK